MRFIPAKHPETGLPPVSTRERVYGHALLIAGEDGSFEYAGETAIDWDTQEPVPPQGYVASADHVILSDENGATWTARRMGL